MKHALPLLLLWGCAEPQLAAADPDDLVVRAWLDGVAARGGVLVVQTAFDPAGDVGLPEPEATGLSFEPEGDPVVEVVGQQQVLTQRYTFTGKNGNYEIEPLVATWSPDQGEAVESSTPPLFVDLGKEPPREQEPEDIVEPEPVRTIPWAFVGAAAAGVALLFAGLAFAFGRSGPAPVAEVEEEPPDIAAIRRWEAIRASDLDDFAKAQALSRVFREYAERVLAFPAGAWTTTEIVEHLKRLAHLPQGNVPRAKRLLRATDRVKFAEVAPGADLFDDLDADLRAFVGSTRPKRWTGSGDGEGTA